MAANCYFALSNGLTGCYMPDSEPSPYHVTTRRDMIAAVRDALEWLEFPPSTIRQVKWTRLWSLAKRNGTSSIHFQITHGGYSLNFHGLTEAEYRAAEAAADY